MVSTQRHTQETRQFVCDLVNEPEGGGHASSFEKEGPLARGAMFLLSNRGGGGGGALAWGGPMAWGCWNVSTTQ